MSFNRARYITVCQQVLVTAATVAVGLSAAGVMTLTIVDPDSGQVTAADVRSAVHQQDETFVETAPVDPKVREVKIADAAVSAAPAPTSTPTSGPTSGSTSGPTKAPAPQARTAPARPRAWKTEHADLAPAAVTAPQKVGGFATVGVTWDDAAALEDDEVEVQVRTRRDGRWSGWTVAEYHDDHQPDVAESRRTRPGTDALVVGTVDEVQVRAATRDGKLPQGMTLAVIDPGKGRQVKAAPGFSSDKAQAGADGEAAAGLAAADLELSAMTHAPKVQVYLRSQWGADERLRDGSPRYGTIKTGFVHHTVNANGYSQADVPGILRSIYKYHTQSRGWSDIGYNFLVDRFGRIWEGRWGGIGRPVIGAHTLGYNDVSFAMSAIGNYETAAPSQALVDAYARLMAWKLSVHSVRAADTAVPVYRNGRPLQAINGHRDAGSTACPGRYLYAKVPEIRASAQRIQDAAQTTTSTPAPDPNAPVPQPADMPAPTTAPRAATALPDVSVRRRVSLGGNAWPDVVFKNSNGDIRAVATNGLVGYTAPVRSSGGWRNMNIIAAVGDMNADGRGDVLGRTTANGYTRIYPGLGGGRVSSTGLRGSYAFKYSTMVTGVGDWDGDGRRDVVSRDRRTGGLYLHRGAGRGAFFAATRIARSWPYSRTSGAGDLSGDGRPDLVAVTSDNRIVVYQGRRGTTMATAFRGSYVRNAVGNIGALAAWGDQTGDGKADVVYRAPNGLTYVFAGSGATSFPRRYGAFTALSGLSHVSAGPMDRGRADLVGRDGAGNLVVARNNNRTNGAGWLAGNLRRPDARAILQVGDWNRDGRNDIITREGDNGRILVVWPGLGDGRFGRGHSLGGGWGSIDRVVGVGDVTGDGFPDLAGSIAGGYTIIWPGNGWNGIKAPQYAPASMRVFNTAGAWRQGNPAPMYLSATRTFVPAGGTNYVGTIPGYSLVTGVGDVNGDAYADVIARDGSGNLWLLPGKTTAGFGPRVWVAAGFSGYQVMG